MLRLSLQLHKWIALIVAIQVLGWVAGGLIMTAIPIEQVRGEQHIGAAALPPAPYILPKSGGAIAPPAPPSLTPLMYIKFIQSC